jgi:hypothetical protein
MKTADSHFFFFFLKQNFENRRITDRRTVPPYRRIAFQKHWHAGMYAGLLKQTVCRLKQPARSIMIGWLRRNLS